MKENYCKVLMDENVVNPNGDLSDVIQGFSHISFVYGSQLEDAIIQQWKALCCISRREESFATFLSNHQCLGDLRDWLYVSQNPFNIYVMQPYMSCCFVNNGVNDCIELSDVHEVKRLVDIRKLRR